MDLAVLVVLAICMLPVVAFTTGAARIVLGFVFLVLCPGYALLAALFPAKDSLRASGRVAPSFVLSLAVIPLTCLALNYTTRGISTYPMVASVVMSALATSAIATFCRRKLSGEQSLHPRTHLRMPRWSGGTKLDRALSCILLFSIMGAMADLVYVATAARPTERFTEFHMLGSAGEAAYCPYDAVLGQPVEVRVGMADREHEHTTCRIEVAFGDIGVQDISPIGLPNGARWEQKVTLHPEKAGTGQKAEFLLYKEDGVDPYRLLTLWLDVRGRD